VSHEASSWALKQHGAGRGPKLLLLVLANHANKQGVCFPGQEALADECECGERTVRRDMEALEEQRLVGRARRLRGGARTSDWIVLAPGGDRGDMTLPSEPDYPAEVVALARGDSPANLAGSPTGQSGHRTSVSGSYRTPATAESEEGARGSSDPLSPPKGAQEDPPPPSPLRARGRRPDVALLGELKQVLNGITTERRPLNDLDLPRIDSAIAAHPGIDPMTAAHAAVARGRQNLDRVDAFLRELRALETRAAYQAERDAPPPPRAPRSCVDCLTRPAKPANAGRCDECYETFAELALGPDDDVDGEVVELAQQEVGVPFKRMESA
jgi:hypothetical protein